MCGVAGIYGTNDEETIRTMMARLAHRGPDAEGMMVTPENPFVFGHRRLAIMDPAGGDQPICSVRGNHAIVANGEIYNSPSHRSRMAERYQFKTKSDIEVALALFVEHGKECISQLDGMFALAIADGQDIFLARDPIGIKPLYLGWRNGDLLFASEIKALANIAEEVKEFPPGSWFHSRFGICSYYDVPAYRPVERSEDNHAALVRQTLERSVVKRLMSDVPIGVFLSGGLDSSIIAALVRPHVDTLHTFSVGVEGSRDIEAARSVAQHLDTIHHEDLLKPEKIAAFLPDILYHLESFDQDLVRSAIPCYFTARLAAQEAKVVLTGEGADEVFAGYSYHHEYNDPLLLQKELRRSIRSLHNINLQRVDRMTMAHSIEGRVPFLDTEMIELAQTIPPALKINRIARHRPVDKWVLRKACEDILPADIVWRDKEQFDEGSGTVDLLVEWVGRWISKAEAKQYMRNHSATYLRSPEECLYHKILRDVYPDPTPVTANVARWADRDGGTII